jgi:hypothetical protein
MVSSWNVAGDVVGLGFGVDHEQTQRRRVLTGDGSEMPGGSVFDLPLLLAASPCPRLAERVRSDASR